MAPGDYMKTKCMQCGKIGDDGGPPLIIKGHECHNDILCSDECRTQWEAEMNLKIEEATKHEGSKDISNYDWWCDRCKETRETVSSPTCESCGTTFVKVTKAKK